MCGTPNHGVSTILKFANERASESYGAADMRSSAFKMAFTTASRVKRARMATPFYDMQFIQWIH